MSLSCEGLSVIMLLVWKGITDDHHCFIIYMVVFYLPTCKYGKANFTTRSLSQKCEQYKLLIQKPGVFVCSVGGPMCIQQGPSQPAAY